MKDETVWLSQQQMAELFGRDRTVIVRHINNFFKDQELDKKEVCAKFAHTTKHGSLADKTQTRKLDFYNLDMIISVGYRVKSKNGIIFRKWATKVLKDYLITKNHTFIDGNKRIAATLFIYFLEFYNILYKNNKQIIDNNTLVALTLLIAQSNPREKELLIDLIMNFLSDEKVVK